jgi:hypothetical protein
MLYVVEYSVFLDSEMRRSGCESLPLGRRFQDHLKYFTKAKYVLPGMLIIIKEKFINTDTRQQCLLSMAG